MESGNCLARSKLYRRELRSFIYIGRDLPEGGAFRSIDFIIPKKGSLTCWIKTANRLVVMLEMHSRVILGEHCEEGNLCCIIVDDDDYG